MQHKSHEPLLVRWCLHMQPAWNVLHPDNAGENARFRGASLASWDVDVKPYTVIRE